MSALDALQQKIADKTALIGIVGLGYVGLPLMRTYCNAGFTCLGFDIDDAYISFRYAQNLLDGHGLVFNPGDPVEGYSNLLWVLHVLELL